MHPASMKAQLQLPCACCDKHARSVGSMANNVQQSRIQLSAPRTCSLMDLATCVRKYNATNGSRLNDVHDCERSPQSKRP